MSAVDADRGEQSSHADDERRFAEIAATLSDAIIAAVPLWMLRTAEEKAARSGVSLDRIDRDRIGAVATMLAAELAPRLEASLTADVDAGAPSPLAVLRSANGPLNDVLDELGVTPGSRDPFLAERFPDDHHDVGPAAFGDLDESVHEPGLMWGAARAHIHLSRRREIGRET